MPLQISNHVCDGRPLVPYQVTAARYIPEHPARNGVTLILTHATSTHKETWQPLLEHLFSLCQGDESSNGILEAWSIENPNHGESAVLNRDIIDSEYYDDWAYPKAVLAFLESRPDGVDFYQRRLVAVGHSNGGTTFILLHSYKPELNFRSFIFLDPTIGTENPLKDKMQTILTQFAWMKKDTWPSREAAYADLSSQPGFRNWDSQALRLFTEKALREHDAAKYPKPFKFRGVTLACTKAYEASCYRANAIHPEAWRTLLQAYRVGPSVHLLLSRQDEFGASALKEEMVKGDQANNAGPTSVQWIEKGGHMFVQAVPEITAKAIWNALCQGNSSDKKAAL